MSKQKIFDWAARQILANAGASGLPPAQGNLKDEFETASYSTYESLVADFGTELHFEARREAAQRHDNPLKIQSGDLATALPRIIFRRAYQRRTGGFGWKLLVAAFGFAAGYTTNKASASEAERPWFIATAGCVALVFIFMTWDNNRETKP